MGRGALSAARPWSLIEQEGLAAGVRWQAQQRLASEAMQQLRKRGAYTRVELAATIARAAAEDPAWQRSAAALDWAAVAAAHVAGRSARECRLQWTNRLDPAINSSPWTEEEEAALQRIAEAAGLADWAAIASELGTGRTAWACLTHYRRAVSPASDGSRGTPASLLADEAVTAAQPEDRNDGSSHSGGTAEDQDQPATTGHADEPLVVQQLGCAVPLPPSPPQPPGPAPRRQNKWTAEEDRRLIYAVRTYGQQKWRKIAVHVPGRSDTQCRERWHNVLNPEVDRGDWTPDEDQLLENAVAAVGLHSWSAVAQLHNTLRVAAAGCGRCGHGDAGRLRRTDNICWRRWKSLSRRSPVLANGGDDGIGVEGAKEQRQQRRRKAESCERRRRKKEPEEQPCQKRRGRREVPATSGGPQQGPAVEPQQVTADPMVEERRKRSRQKRRGRREVPANIGGPQEGDAMELERVNADPKLEERRHMGSVHVAEGPSPSSRVHLAGEDHSACSPAANAAISPAAVHSASLL
eukprot:SM000005S17269  [mRNA]  locus=s5:1095014:1097384:+ [translate_table: standard]